MLPVLVGGLTVLPVDLFVLVSGLGIAIVCGKQDPVVVVDVFARTEEEYLRTPCRMRELYVYSESINRSLTDVRSSRRRDTRVDQSPVMKG